MAGDTNRGSSGAGAKDKHNANERITNRYADSTMENGAIINEYFREDDGLERI